ncbi:MAG TPA: biotin/lipoyl-containing protein [Baekduia sp.]|uniref:acetyl-CoA carboxylase biotin carboxyl carrier protein n=1 Tax=Baekduia sp. TaxID=2600305 RepID=UPI002C4198CF|nr:biotin/lipoyl-containing protein [Baekduia sp.]HMJ33943.1 biotin/lipoyl-containing protein [Baekduia sp.]
MEMNPETIRALLDAFERSDWQEMTVTIGADRLHVSRDGVVEMPAPTPPAPAPAPAPVAAPTPNGAPAAAPAVEAAVTAPQASAAASPAPASAARDADVPGTVIPAPSVGLFWRAPSPSSPPFVEVGSRVSVGDTVGIVEVMKLMNHVVAPVAGLVTGVHVADGAMVEFGQPLVVIDPEA